MLELRLSHQLRRRAMTVLELLVTMTATSMLISLLLPAIQAARESARNVQCQNHLHQIGVSLHQFHIVHGKLPAGWLPESSGTSAFAWAVAVLPGIEGASSYGDIDRTRPLVELPEEKRSATPAVLMCPSDSAEPTFKLFAEEAEHGSQPQESELELISLPRANFIGVFGTIDPDDVPDGSGDGTFVGKSAHRFAELTRGLSNTTLVGERTARKLPSTWLGIVFAGEDAAGRIVGHADLGPNRDDADECEFDSRHPGHVNFLWADGRTEAMADSVDSQVYRDSARRF
jgi:prepilin-type processing-associated H-X9-DG protein